MKKVLMIIVLLAFLFIPCAHSSDFSLIRSIKNTAPSVLPGFLAGFLLQSQIQKTSIYAHVVALPVSMFVTNKFAKKYYKASQESESVNDYKYSSESAYAGAFFMYGLGFVTGTLWKTYWFKRA